MELLQLKQQVLDMSKKAYDEKLFAGTSGNLSVKDCATGYIAITPTSIPYPQMVLEDIVVIDEEGKVIEGRHKPSSEWRLHTEIYKKRTDVSSVVHTHSPYATGFAVAHKNIPVVLIEMMFFLMGDVPVCSYCPPGSLELGEKAVEAMYRRGGCLLANHGVVSIGKDLEEAYLRAVYIEDAAKIYVLSKSVGIPVEIPPDEQNAIRKRMGIEETNE